MHGFNIHVYFKILLSLIFQTQQTVYVKYLIIHL